ncbi:unnamed protein product [Clonostachys solani]|uniref:DNA2/NAM7 helicase-like C-terminal domain-containing protein n=1 Tax=Clonostachys solani TaxID=160281 RepID=A0A9N9ZFC7_9HYPO|nr:unnamed protein product [Clonostachys solani]
MSPLNFFKVTGVAVYVLRIQYRMADDLFGLCHRYMYSDVDCMYSDVDCMYSDVDCMYHEACDPNLPKHQIGRTLEVFALSKLPGLKKYDDDKLRSIFVHCPGSRSIKARGRRSTLNPDQNRAALKFLVKFVRENKIDPSRIKLITPYRANRDELERPRRKDAELVHIAGMEPVATVDSFQGREGDVVFVVMKSGLVIIGDINIMGKVFGDGKGKAKGKAKTKHDSARVAVVVKGGGGKVSFLRSAFLISVCQELVNSGRVVEAPAEQQCK